MKNIKLLYLIFLPLIIINCSANKVRYTFIPEQSLQNIKPDLNNLKLLLYIYPENDVNKKINIKTNNSVQLYLNKNTIKSEFLEIEIPINTKFLLVEYNGKRSKIEINFKYKYLYIEFRGKDLLETVYSDKKPVFID
ncbi:hypothetical protein [Halpernia frigidisoli]|uniref:Uncharacterized protein n=1 Tax=Halpernia frigidisoli TaxID=1125876 RepID=A0A1I3DQ22_9FLAO|nr:hypothetical protein [Halpernia frigidisoli]SFH88571.1 hypothetical protein SAMN05443292_0616 [Halpernia frigidisoli]